MLENKIDQLIEDCITELCCEQITNGAESLQELAQYYAKAGMGMQSFLDTRTYIINQAKEKTDALFIDEKLSLAEQKQRELRTGTRFILN